MRNAAETELASASNDGPRKNEAVVLPVAGAAPMVEPSSSIAADATADLASNAPEAPGTAAPQLAHSRCQRAFVASMPPVFVVIWATGFIAARYAMPYSPPFQFLSLRFGVSAACFVVWALLSGAQWPKSRAQVAHLAVTGILMHAGYLGGVWASVRMGMGAGLSSLIVGVQPVPTAIWVSLWGGKLPWKQWLGLALGVGGLVLVVWQKLGKGEVTPLNLGCCFVSLFCITAGTLYQKRFVLPCDVRTANMVQLAAALCVALPIGFGAYPGQQIQWTDAASGAVNGPLAGSLAWSVLGLTLGGSSLLYMMIQAGAATAVTRCATHWPQGVDVAARLHRSHSRAPHLPPWSLCFLLFPRLQHDVPGAAHDGADGVGALRRAHDAPHRAGHRLHGQRRVACREAARLAGSMRTMCIAAWLLRAPAAGRRPTHRR